MEQKNNDNVNHPSHYTDGKYECIAFIESWGLGFHLGNAVKYISRAGKKDPSKMVEDLEKAKWYISRLRDQLVSCRITRNDRDSKAINVYNYAVDKGLSFNLKMALIVLLEECNFDQALTYLDEEIDFLKNHMDEEIDFLKNHMQGGL